MQCKQVTTNLHACRHLITEAVRAICIPQITLFFFRISFASKQLHDIITNIYNNRDDYIDNVSNVNDTDFVSNLTEIEATYGTTRNLMKLAAHQIEDMLLWHV